MIFKKCLEGDWTGTSPLFNRTRAWPSFEDYHLQPWLLLWFSAVWVTASRSSFIFHPKAVSNTWNSCTTMAPAETFGHLGAITCGVHSWAEPWVTIPPPHLVWNLLALWKSASRRGPSSLSQSEFSMSCSQNIVSSATVTYPGSSSMQTTARQ